MQGVRNGACLAFAWSAGSGVPWSFLCQMEREGRANRPCPRPRCWVHSRPGLETLLARGAGSTRQVAAARAGWPVSSHHPVQVHRAGTLQAYRDGEVQQALLPQFPDLMCPGGCGAGGPE